MDKPTLTSAAATIIIKKTKICASLANVGDALAATLIECMFENATNNKFTALSISSTHIKTTMALRRLITPAMPMQKRVRDKVM